MSNMRFPNPIYTRTWTKIVSPVSTMLTHLGKQLGLPTVNGQTSTDESLLPLTSTSNGHLRDAPDAVDNEHLTPFNSSMHPLKTFVLSLLSPFRSGHSSLVSYGRHVHRSDGKFSRQDRFSENKSLENNTIYHQLPLEIINDENNNNTHGEEHPKSTIIHLPPVKPSSANELFNDTWTCTREQFLWIFSLTMIYYTWFIFIAGISILHVGIHLLILGLYVLSDRTRRFILAFLIYLFYLLLYDALHLMPNYSISKVHIRDVYLTEKKLFGIFSNGHLMTLNEYFRVNHRPVLDVFTGLCYLNWIPVPIAYSLYLYRYKSKRDYMDFALTFLLTNMLGFVIYYIVPAAPPWYIELYGFDMNMQAPGYPAGFLNFDQITGIKLFTAMYSKNANVFAAIPSLHAAYPLITVLYGSLSKKLWLHIAFVLFTLSVWFSAVYSRHHYVLDVLAGGTCAVTAYLLYRLLSRVPTINRLLTAYSKVI